MVSLYCTSRGSKIISIAYRENERERERERERGEREGGKRKREGRERDRDMNRIHIDGQTERHIYGR